jgi:hypothetical protein
MFCRSVFKNTESFISNAYDLLRGVPQGSINGPSFYVLFFNDICNVLKGCYYSIFADDLVFHVCDTDVKNGMSKILNCIDKWCDSRINVKLRKNEIYDCEQETK